MKQIHFTIVIPTYKRPVILTELISDLSKQTVLPDKIIVVDGDPASMEVPENLRLIKKKWGSLQIHYVPSNHANAPYQRYLGSGIADAPVIVFVDDDIRIRQQDALEKILEPFTWSGRLIAGVTPKIIFPARSAGDGVQKKQWFAFLQSSYGLAPGQLTPVGDRIPLDDTTNAYDQAQWLRGGVMAYRAEFLLKAIYSEDVFAMSHIRCGLGVDDTYLSRCVGIYGKLLQANCAAVEHPDLDASKISAPEDMRQLGFARAYSRRFHNDHYRLHEPPHYADRLALVKNYAWNMMLNWLNAIMHLKFSKYAYAWGYTLGVLHGLFQRPAARTLTPEISWQTDAQSALSGQTVISENSL